MSDDPVSIEPFIRRRRQAECPHLYTEVDDAAASLTCNNCGVEIDPWWYIRRLARDGEAYRDYYEKMAAAHNAWTQRALATVKQLQDEINELTAVRNELANEHVGGRLLGHVARKMRGSR